ncbi:hypothetical protein F5Y04DRAFT_266381 [Hypomontagnella monticulosa]|nr:hypothetical protein F5Y04DRAFT_266381 [Hypomontagnella monticulosa]
MGSEDLDITPVTAPPLGQTSDFINPISRSHEIVLVIAITLPLVILLTVLRIYARLYVTHFFGLDDWLCIAATISTIAYSGLVLKLSFKPGGGVIGIHLWDVPISHYLVYSKGSLADQLLMRFSSNLVKVAFLVFYYRLFYPFTHVRIMIWAGVVAVVTFTTFFVVVYLVVCCPWPGEHGGWMDPSLLARCSSIAPNLVTAAVYFSVVADLYILFIPLHQLPSLNLSRKKKIGVSFVFLTGLIAIAAGLINVVVRTDNKMFDQSDFSWTIVPLYVTSLIELNAGLMCLSMPVVFVLFVGRLTHLSNSFSSWIDARLPHHGSGGSEGYSDLVAEGIVKPKKILTGMRDLASSVRRSVVRGTEHRENNSATLDEGLTSAEYSYHHQLRDIQSGSPKVGNTGANIHGRNPSKKNT